MESNKKKINIIGKIRNAYRKFMFQEEAVKKMEELDQKPFKERFKKRIWNYLYGVLCVVAIIGLVVYSVYVNNNTNKEIEDEGVYLTKQLEGEKKDIESGEFTKYMIDTINNSYIKIAQTKIGENVAYSLVYRYDVIPEGEMTATSYFSKGYVTSILINGYPNVGYEELGLESEEEAYLATQLAVYEYVAQNQIKDMAIGEFSLDSIEPSQDEYTQMVQRVTQVAKEIYSKAMQTPYEDITDIVMDNTQAKLEIKENESVYGPITITSTTDEYTKGLMGENYNPVTKIDLKSYLEDITAVAIDEEENEIDTIANGGTFYVKINSTDKIFSQLKTISNTYYLYARIYETLECDKKYVTLEANEVSYTSIFTIYNDMDMGKVNISLMTEGDKYVDGVSYYIYNENNELIQDIDGFTSDYSFTLAAGNYYVKVYDVPKDYFVEEIHEFEVKSNEETDLRITIESLDELE